jgi:O-antigen ligase
MRQIAIWISWLLLFVLPWEFMHESGNLGTGVRLVGIALAGVWLLSVLVQARLRRPHALHLPMIAFALWCGASILWSLDPEASREQVTTYLQLVLLAVIVWDLYTTPATLHTGLQAYVLGSWVCVLTLLQSFVSGEVQRRFSVGLFNQNTLGFILVLGIPVAWHLAVGAREHMRDLGGRLAPILRLSNLVFIPAALFCISLTASRSSMAAAVLGLIYMALSLGGLRGGSRILIVSSAAAVAIYGVSLIPRESVDRLESTTVELSDGDWNGRLPIWQEALNMVEDRPLTGVGVSAFHTAAVKTNKAPHSLPLSLLAELGLVGFLLFGAILVGCAIVSLHQPPRVALFWLTMLGAWFVCAVTHNFEDKKITRLLFGLIAASDGLRSTGMAPRPEAATPPAAPLGPANEARA